MLEKKVADLPTKPLSKEEKAKDIPSMPMSVEDYVRERVNEQINTFYVPSAKKYETYSRRWNVGRWFLGAIAAILGVVGGAAPSSMTGVWIGVVGVMTSAVAAHTAAGRYSYLVLSYQSTSDQLEKLVSAWRDKIIDDQELVQECEATISVENQAWMAQGIRTARPV